MTRLILVRHGETDWNVRGIYQGQADPPLNARGETQAREAAERLQAMEVRPAAIYASPLRRAWQTAEIIAAALPPAPLRAEPRLMEIHLGAWQERHVDEIARRWPEIFRQWEENPWRTRPPGGETLAEVQQRVDAAIDDILARHPRDTVIVVAHRLPIAFVKVRFQGLDPAEVRHIPVPNAEPEAIEVAR